MASGVELFACINCNKTNEELSKWNRECQSCWQKRKQRREIQYKSRERKGKDRGTNSKKFVSYKTNHNNLSQGVADKSKNLDIILCKICEERPRDASFIHKNTSHQYTCYRCAKKLYRIRPTCPVCRMKIEKITLVLEL